MRWTGTAAAIVLAGVLVWAAVAKLVDRAGTATAFRQMLPAIGERGTARLALAVPIVELVLAVALLAIPRVGGVATLAALIALTVVLIGVMHAGRDVPCPCFGSHRVRPVGRGDLVRNAGLMALAAFVVFFS